MKEQFLEEIRNHDLHNLLEKYFPGKVYENTAVQAHYMEFCQIAEKIAGLQQEKIPFLVESQFSLLTEAYKDPGRRIIGKKYITDADASKAGACQKCLGHANRIFKWPQEAHLMPKLPLHPNCKCHYENVYEPHNEKNILTEIKSVTKQYMQTKKQIKHEIISFARGMSDLVIKMKNAKSFSEFLTWRTMVRPVIKVLSLKIKVQVYVLKADLHTVNFILDYVAQNTNIKWIKQSIFSLKKYAENIRKTYDEMKNIHYERLDYICQQVQYLPKNPKEARSEEAQKEGWKKATENQNWYHRNNGEIHNVKYYNEKTGQEVIYDSDRDDAKIVTSVENIGTYNHASPDEIFQHTLLDVFPYWLWGNSEDDHTPIDNRLLGN